MRRLLITSNISKAFVSVSNEIPLTSLKNPGTDIQGLQMTSTICQNSWKYITKENHFFRRSTRLYARSYLIHADYKQQTLVSLLNTLKSHFLHAACVSNLHQLIRNNRLLLTQTGFAKLWLLTKSHRTQRCFIGPNFAQIPTDTVTEIGGCHAKPSTPVRYLEVHLADVWPSWRWKHLYKINGKVIYLNRRKYKVPPKTKIAVAQTLALTIINYCVNIRGSANITWIQKENISQCK